MAQISEYTGCTEVLFNTFGIDRAKVTGNFKSIELNLFLEAGGNSGQIGVTPALLNQYNKCRVNINNGQYIGGLGAYLMYCMLFYNTKRNFVYAESPKDLYTNSYPFYRCFVDTPLINSIEFVNDTPVSIVLEHGFTYSHPTLKSYYLTEREPFAFPGRKKNVMLTGAGFFENLLPPKVSNSYVDNWCDSNFPYKTVNEHYYKTLVDFTRGIYPIFLVYDCVGVDSVLTIFPQEFKTVIIYQD